VIYAIGPYYLIRKQKPCYAAVNFDTYRNLQRHCAIFPAIARHLVFTGRERRFDHNE